MNRRQMPDKLTGTKNKYPYLARVKGSVREFKNMIVLVEVDKKTIVIGGYSGHNQELARRYSNGTVHRGETGISENNLTQLNKERVV